MMVSELATRLGRGTAGEPQDGGVMAGAHNAAMVRRAAEKIWDRGQLDLADVLFASDYINHAGLIEELGLADPACIPIVAMSTVPRDAGLILGPGAGECRAKAFDLDEVLARVSRYSQADTLPSQLAGTDARSAYLEQ